MPRAKFTELLDEVAQNSKFFQELTPDQETHSKNYNGCESVDPRHKLAAALRWMAGGSHLDIRLVHGMSKSMMYKCLWHTVDAVNDSKKFALYIPWEDEKGLQDLELGFATLSEGLFRGCLMSIDGFCAQIQAPTGVLNVQDFWNRKGIYAYVVQANVSASGKFIGASFKATGSTHDSLALKMSRLWEKLCLISSRV